MICNRCGAENDDGNRLCADCGHKLQSREREEATGGDVAGDAATKDRGRGATGPASSFGPGRDPGVFLSPAGGRRPSVWGEMAFVWGLALVLCGAAVWSLAAGVYWPLYPLTGVAALLAWRRKR
ncbi:MAG: zinc ribbon domain-containing protein [Desulfovibrionaceae bacterium]|nr:zinc ribbon domain-containing protein [Desulfovibrionaceae bacterium]